MGAAGPRRHVVAHAPFPVADPALLVEDDGHLRVQVKGKVRGRVEVAADASARTSCARCALAREPRCSGAGRPDGVRTVIVRAPKLVNVVPV